MKVKEFFVKLKELMREGRGNCEIICRSGDVEDIGWDKEYPDIELNFENDTAIIDFSYFDFNDVERKQSRFDVYCDLLESSKNE